MVAPRHATALELLSVAAVTNFMKHEICLNEKTTGTACPATSTTAPVVTKVKIVMAKAKFFNQSWSISSAAPATFDKVEWAQEWKVNGDCTAALTMVGCKQSYATFGNETVSNQNKIWVARGAYDEVWNVVYDAKPLANATVTINAAKHSGTMTNKLTAWSGNDPTIKVESNAAAKDSLVGAATPSTSSYGWTVDEITSVTGLAFKGWTVLAEAAFGVYVDATSAANNVNSLGVGAAAGRLDWKLKTIKRYKGATAGLNLTTAVTADGTDKWMSKANGTTDKDKIYLVGVKAKISGNETPAPASDGVSSTIVVVPRHASALEILTVAAGAGTGFMKHDICLREKTGAACDVTNTTAKPAAKIPNTDAKFFNQVWSTGEPTTPVAYDKVE
jgi:hypothetical protein